MKKSPGEWPETEFKRSFFVVDLELEEQEKTYLLLHIYKPLWVVANSIGLEIAEYLDKYHDSQIAANLLVEKYDVPIKKVLADTLSMEKKLRKEDFLDALELPQRKPVSSLTSLFINITAHCNLSCLHCYASSSPHEKNHLSAETIFRIIDEFVDCGGQKLTISGGEPLMHKEIREILTYALARLKEIRLLSNGSMIDEYWANYLSEHKIPVQLSLDGSKQEIHDAVRGTGSFSKVIKAVERLQNADAGELLSFAMTVMRNNIADVPSMVALARKLHIPLLRFLPLQNLGRTEDNQSKIAVDDYRSFFDYIEKAKLESDTPRIDCSISSLFLKLTDDIPSDCLWCPVGNMLTVYSDGNIYSCPLFVKDDLALGNIYQNTLTEALQSEVMKENCDILSQRHRTIPDCRQCDWRNFCQAGCMALPLHSKDNFWHKDPFCTHRKKGYRDFFRKVCGKKADE